MRGAETDRMLQAWLFFLEKCINYTQFCSAFKMGDDELVHYALLAWIPVLDGLNIRNYRISFVMAALRRATLSAVQLWECDRGLGSPSVDGGAQVASDLLAEILVMWSKDVIGHQLTHGAADQRIVEQTGAITQGVRCLEALRGGDSFLGLPPRASSKHIPSKTVSTVAKLALELIELRVFKAVAHRRVYDAFRLRAAQQQCHVTGESAWRLMEQQKVYRCSVTGLPALEAGGGLLALLAASAQHSVVAGSVVTGVMYWRQHGAYIEKVGGAARFCAVPGERCRGSGLSRVQSQQQDRRGLPDCEAGLGEQGRLAARAS
jgi:hypothetical protein